MSRLLASHNRIPATNGAPTTVTACAAMMVGVRSKSKMMTANATDIPVSNAIVVMILGARSVGSLPSPKPSETIKPPIIELIKNEEYAAEKSPRQKINLP